MEFVAHLKSLRNKDKPEQSINRGEIDYDTFARDFIRMTAFRDYLRAVILQDNQNVYSDMEAYVKAHPDDKIPTVTRTYPVPTDLADGMTLFFDTKKYPIDVLEKYISEQKVYEGFKVTICPCPSENAASVRYEVALYK